MKKLIINIHHWLGSFFCVLFLCWFLSGFVMMYQSFPKLSGKERISLQEKGITGTLLSPFHIFQKDSVQEITSLRLQQQLHRPVFHLKTTTGKTISRYADTGALLDISSKRALDIATAATQIIAVSEITSLTKLDQWIPRTHFLSHLPIYKITFEDPSKTHVYVSSLTGELLQKTTQKERFWTWLGAIPHWIYFRDLRVHNTLWYQLVTWLAFFGLIMTISGMYTGIIRYKKKPKKRFQRFKNKWYNLHYYFGLIFGVFVCTWTFSGMMSMTPLNWTPSTSLSKTEQQLWKKHPFVLTDFEDITWQLFGQSSKVNTAREIVFSKFQGDILTHFITASNTHTSFLNTTDFSYTKENFAAIIQLFSLKNKIEDISLLTEYDAYYYSRHNTRKLPVLRINTEQDITYYIDPDTASFLFKSSTKNKIERWLYHGLHSLDFSFLAWNRPLWDITLIFLLLGGTIISGTGVVLGWKFYKRKLKKRRKKRKK
ncbi:PepSY domain-containing protein [Aquimarina hainanensis]|uniref:PepSY domain-containing protein n=1 Tax=Aquimarina hainanensis TaxID=1578017 RepID=A0ABW5NA19_9FLAO